MAIKFDRLDLLEYFEYLDDLRDRGETNMFGASAYLEEEYALSTVDARNVLGLWMQTFDEDADREDRVSEALSK